jgi:uncharacterized membrane protein (DUF4010 family)
MAAIFQLVLGVVHVARERFGAAGLLVSGFALGLTDVDALTVSMARSAAEGAPLTAVARAIALGALANTLVKLVLTVSLGASAFRRPAAAGLLALALACVVSLAVL